MLSQTNSTWSSFNFRVNGQVVSQNKFANSLKTAQLLLNQGLKK